jgi:hypothetical protein
MVSLPPGVRARAGRGSLVPGARAPGATSSDLDDYGSLLRAEARELGRPWTGGGGTFGGAGATGSWAAAIGTVASGVSAPSESSGGGSSGGGGGGSSGGGSGGGW